MHAAQVQFDNLIKISERLILELLWKHRGKVILDNVETKYSACGIHLLAAPFGSRREI